MEENVILDVKENDNNFDFSYASLIGDRDYQEDFVTIKVTDNYAFFAVFDGMGGLENGNVASKTAALSFMKSFETYDFDNLDVFLEKQIRDANNSVYNENKNAGTTVIALYIINNEFYYLSAGDSRLYILRNNNLVQLSSDHNYRTLSGDTSDKKKAEALVSFLGLQYFSIYDILNEPLEIEENDIFLLSSDGLYKALDDEKIKDILSRDKSIELKKYDFCNAIKAKSVYKSLDNTSFILIERRKKALDDET